MRASVARLPLLKVCCRGSRSEDARRAFEAETRKEIDRLQKSLGQSEAHVAVAHENVERLTQAAKSAEAETTHLGQKRDQLQARVATAEAGVEVIQAELQKTAQALERAQEGERRARDEAAELRGQLKAADEKPKK